MKYKILLLSFLLSIFLRNEVFAISAYPYPVTIKQVDNTELTIQLVGDEFFHYTQTTDGLLIQRNEKEIFEYVDLNSENKITLSGVKVNDVTKRASKEIEYTKSLREKRVKEKSLEIKSKNSKKLVEENTVHASTLNVTAIPVTGTKKVLCILIGYQDRAFSKTQSNFNNLMNQTGYNGTGSVKDFYKENSYNQLDLNVTVVGPYTADYNMAYYGANDANDNDINPQALIVEALQKADPSVNYADFDNDGDGKVDGVHVIFAGYDEAFSGVSPNAIWSHRWAIPGLTLDGKLITDYSCSSELKYYTGNTICGIGTACHEMGHIFGASDFYDTNEGQVNDGDYKGTGVWDLMASGGWNYNYGDKPAHFNPYTKTQTFQWATLQNITLDNVITLYPANSNGNSFYRLNTFTPGEYFLIENRQKLGFDAGLPGDGMLVYHVHRFFNGYSQTNNITHPQRFYPVCASATQNPNSTPASYGDINNAGCPFPGTSSKTSLTRQTMPGLISWAGEGTGFDFQSIYKNGNNIVLNPKTYYPISGASQLCSQATYTISPPPGSSVTWSSSPDNIITLPNPPTGQSITVTKTGNGQVTLTALINNNVAISKNIWLGAPATPTDMSGIYNGQNFGSGGMYSLSITGGDNLQYEWVVYGAQIIEGQGTDRITILTETVYGDTPIYLNVSARVGNACGWGGYISRSGYVLGDPGPIHRISPNPTPESGTVTIEQISATDNATTEDWTLEVYDTNQTLKQTKKVKGVRITKINTSGWQKGIYFIRIKTGKKVETQKLVVQ